MSLFAGQATVNNLTIKRSLLDNADLPLSMKMGTIRKIELTLPWTKLMQESTVVRIVDVFVLLEPKDVSQVSASTSSLPPSPINSPFSISRTCQEQRKKRGSLQQR